MREAGAALHAPRGLGRFSVSSQQYAHPVTEASHALVRSIYRPVTASLPGRESIDVVAVDADALLKDACVVLLSGQKSVLLQAIDTGTVVAIMSEQAFREIGWMSGPAARGHNVSNSDLRLMLATDYLPRIPVVITAVAGEHHWVPQVDDVTDPNDVAHVEVARLVSGTAVLSHDRHLRIPGHAPRSRALYDERLGRVGLVSTYREREWGVGLVLAALGSGTNYAVGRAATHARLSRPAAWSVAGFALAAGLFWANSNPSRRSKLADAVEWILTNIVEAHLRAASAERAIQNDRLLAPGGIDRFEVQVAAYLVRHPDSNKGEIADALSLGGRARTELSALLREHPAFERSSRLGWAVGRIRDALETEPSKDYRPS